MLRSSPMVRGLLCAVLPDIDVLAVIRAPFRAEQPDRA
jgi:hypothetical protein